MALKNVIDLPTADALPDHLDDEMLEEVTKLSTGDLVRRVCVGIRKGCTDDFRIGDLLEVAIDQMPNSCEAGKALAVLDALRDRLRIVSNERFELDHAIAALIERVQAAEVSNG